MNTRKLGSVAPRREVVAITRVEVVGNAGSNPQTALNGHSHAATKNAARGTNEG